MKQLNQNLDFEKSVNVYYETIQSVEDRKEKDSMENELKIANHFLSLENQRFDYELSKLPSPLYAKEQPAKSFLHHFAWISRFLFGLGVSYLLYNSYSSSSIEESLGLVDKTSHIRIAETSDIRFSDVKGIDTCREEIEEIVEFLKNPEKFTKLGAKLHKGILLTGRPGTGKTLLARAIAGEAGVKFFFNSGADFDEMFIGLGASRIRELFKAARENAPCIVFIDEIDALASMRAASEPAARQTVNQLLVEIDGFKSSDNVVVIGATNFPEVIDHALKRPGRFDKEIHVPLPDNKGRREILELYLKKIKYDPDMNIEFITKKTVGMNGASIANLVNIAATYAAKHKKSHVGAEDFEYAIDRVIIGMSRGSYKMSDEEVMNTAYHELGHAFMANYTGFTEVHKITIIPRGHTLGHTAFLPKKEHDVWNKNDILGAIDTAVAGRAAEEIFSGKAQVTTGCSSDLQSATRFIYSAIRAGLFFKETGFSSFNKIEELGDIRRNQVDDFANRIIIESYNRTLAILQRNKKLIKHIAKILKEKETLTNEEFIKLIKNFQSYNMSDKDKSESFSELLNAQIRQGEEDKYDLKQFGDVKKEGKLWVKWTRIKKILFGDTGVSNKFLQGVLMGATVGGITGTLFGLVSFYQHRKIIYVPLTALIMAGSFGFFMGVGSVIRTDNTKVFVGTAVIEDGNLVVKPPEWQIKYKAY